jgi:hypothetical protein
MIDSNLIPIHLKPLFPIVFILQCFSKRVIIARCTWMSKTVFLQPVSESECCATTLEV